MPEQNENLSLPWYDEFTNRMKWKCHDPYLSPLVHFPLAQKRRLAEGMCSTDSPLKPTSPCIVTLEAELQEDKDSLHEAAGRVSSAAANSL